MLIQSELNNDSGIDTEVAATLGDRPMDRDHDWDSDLEKFSGIDLLKSLDGERWIQESRADTTPGEVELEYIDPSTLNTEQRHIFDLILNHHREGLSNPLRLIISGTAGSGKSYLLKVI